MKKLISFLAFGLITSFSVSNIILAQDDTVISNRQIDEIIVTSRKTEENLSLIHI